MQNNIWNDARCRNCHKGRVELRFICCADFSDLQSQCTRRHLHVAKFRTTARVVRIDEDSNHPSVRHQLAQQFEPFHRQLLRNETYTSGVTARSVIRLATMPAAIGSAPLLKTIGILVVASLEACAATTPAAAMAGT